MLFQMYPSIVVAHPGKMIVSVGAVSLGEGAGPQRGHGRALDEAKVWAHAQLPTVSCGTEPMYTQWQKRGNYKPLTSASPRGLCFVTGTSLEAKNVSAYLIQLQHSLIPTGFLFITEALS